MGGSMTDEVMTISLGGSGKPAATLTLLPSEPIEALFDDGVFRRDSAISEEKYGEGRCIGIAGEICDLIR